MQVELFARHLEEPDVEVVNFSESGADTEATVHRILAGAIPASYHPTAVVVALSLANEGLCSSSTPASAARVASRFLSGLETIARLLRVMFPGVVPILAGIYPNDCYLPQHIEALRTVQRVSERWANAGDGEFKHYSYIIDFMSRLEEPGTGRWKRGLAADPGHPNDAGHEQMFLSVDTAGLLAAVRSGTSTSKPALLCFGDSLTAGWHSNGMEFSPWGSRLAAAAAVAGGALVVGANGLTATELIAKKLDPAVPDAIGRMASGIELICRSKIKLCAAVIMIGTNDLAEESNAPPQILEAITAHHKACHDRGVKTLCVSVPENAFTAAGTNAPTWKSPPGYTKRWQDLNVLLKKWAGEEPMTVFVECPVRYFQPNASSSGVGGDCWDDALHMTPRGYEIFADRIAPSLKALLSS